jgi:hypothetical protein
MPLRIQIHPMKMSVAQGRPGIFQLKYAGGIQIKNPMQEKTVKGMSVMPAVEFENKRLQQVST